MDLARFDAICGALPNVTMVIQWRGAHVWKIGGKVFAVGWSQDQSGDTPCPFTIKVDDMALEFLRQEDGVEIAPYFRSPNWLRFHPDCTIADDDLAGYIARSRGLIIEGLPKKRQSELLN
ncbi:MAG: MmcQ/YjbR family DNA-binding protein [Pseudomonadota bacterium]